MEVSIFRQALAPDTCTLKTRTLRARAAVSIGTAGLRCTFVSKTARTRVRGWCSTPPATQAGSERWLLRAIATG
eukprot:SAG25_NODE_671_length_6034_cov_47.077843_3_plen_74_part_00